jgi:hypothetical protein
VKPTKPQAKSYTAADIEKVRKALSSIQSGQTRINPTTQLLNDLMPDIQKAREAGASWTVIAAQINTSIGSKIHPATIRSHANKKSKGTEATPFPNPACPAA